MTIQKEQHSKTKRELRSPRAGVRPAGAVRSAGAVRAVRLVSSVRPVGPVSPTRAVLLVLAVLGLMLLAFSCFPPPIVAGESSDPTAPGAATRLTIDRTDSTSFGIRWDAPIKTGTTSDGTALSAAEIGYRIYYLIGIAGQTRPSAESIKLNPNALNKNLIGRTQATVSELTPSTRYFVTVESYNFFAQHLGTTSNEAIEVNTSASTDGGGVTVEDFIGTLNYGQATYQYDAGSQNTITPLSKPTIPDTDVSGTTILYALIKRSGVDFNPPPSIDGNGVITIDSIANTGGASYFVQASATGYNVKQVGINIIIVLGDSNGGSDGFTAPGAATDLTVDRTNSTSFGIRWNAPTDRGTKLDGTALGTVQIGYYIYYLEGTAGELQPSAESIKLNPNTLNKNLIGFTQTNISDLTPSTRYFVTMESYNSFAQHLGTISNEVIEVNTSANDDGGGVSRNFDGNLSYRKVTYKYNLGSQNTITPLSIPTIPDIDTSDPTIHYILVKRGGTDFNPPPSIDSSGVITVDSIVNTGTASYVVQASATSYVAQQVALNIVIVTGGSNGRGFTTPGAATDLAIDRTDSTSFGIRWNVPTYRGTSLDGTVLDAVQVGYYIYYLAGSAGELQPSAESIKENPNTLNKNVTGLVQTNISDLIPGTRYFVTIESYNSLAQYLRTISNEVIEVSTDVDGGGASGDFDGIIRYRRGTFQYNVRSQGIITPFTTPTIPNTDTSGTTIRYNLVKRNGTDFNPPPSISDTGVITINSITNTGTASYFVQASATGYGVQQVALDIVIIYANFDGDLIYEQTAYEFDARSYETITPFSTPTVPDTDTNGTTIRYDLVKRSGTDFNPPPSISDTGVITINSITNTGTASYLVRASATGYVVQQVALDIVIVIPNLDGDLVYETATYRSATGTNDTITPLFRPTIPRTDTNGTTIRYDLEKRSGTDFNPAPSISGTGVITINSITNVGVAIYDVRAEAVGYRTQEVMLIIVINRNVNESMLQVSTYHSETTTALPVEFGQAIEDSGSFAMANNAEVVRISSASGLANGNYTIHFGVENGGANNYSGSYQKTASGGAVTILKSEFTANAFSFADGTVIGISGSGITGIQYVAVYLPSNIYNHQDLQAMRQDLARDYELKKNIEFPPATGTSTSNYEAVGGSNDSFTGSLNGASNTIIGIRIEGTDTDNSQGLFGIIEADAASTVIVQNLVLRDFKITGNAYVGSLAGQVKRGVIENVSVEISAANAGKVEASGAINVNRGSYGYGGGLIGRAGTGIRGVPDPQVKIQNTSSAVAVSGTGISSGRIGGLVGEVSVNVILTESFATGLVTGSGSDVGGLAGYNNGTVSDSRASGSVTGSGIGVGGLVGYNSGSVSDSHATGLVTGSGSDVGGLVGENYRDTVSGYATGSVTGNGDVGGLVGYNNAGTVLGYATGSVTGKNGNIGGLAGNNRGTVSGYATGLVTGDGDNVGGLVGYSRSTVSGYATGSVIGDGNNVGGLVGLNDAGTISGYATGSVTGNNRVGGLVGLNDQGNLIGYVRSIVRRASGTGRNLGTTVGSLILYAGSEVKVRTFSSSSKSRIYDGTTGRTELAGVVGFNAYSLTPEYLSRETFSNVSFSFGTSIGEWIWVENGKWPAINIGEVKSADEQPVEGP